MEIHLTVMGHPPIKYGNKSMWTRPDQKKQVIALREEAKGKLGEKEVPRDVQIKLKIEIDIPQKPEYEYLARGDLDNYITGICDSLQKAHENAWPHITDERAYISPKEFFLIDDDKNIFSITARKNTKENITKVSYEVTLKYGPKIHK